ncbi:GNAT family N-acetyltransferase [Mariniphaga sediminis]|nr:GNAT family N-acetyltransferase [Mariniphaga sediminis]
MEFDFISEEVLEEKLTGDPGWNPKSTFVTQKEGRVAGFMQGVYRNVRGVRYGYIKLMAVEKESRKQGIARAMYLQLEDYFERNKVDAVRIYDVPLNYFMPGIDPRYTAAVCFAERMGFVRNGDTSNLDIDLQHQNWSEQTKIEELKAQQIEVSRATEADRAEITELLGTDWHLWQYEVDRAIESSPPSLHIARLNGKVLAFAAHNANNKGTGWFGPMLTHNDMRGKGIGGVLLKLCLQDMKNEGLEKSIIPWVGPIPFYAHQANAKVARVFWRYEKKLTTPKI